MIAERIGWDRGLAMLKDRIKPAGGRGMTSEPMSPAPSPQTELTRVLRQQVLVLYLANSALDSHVVGWSLYDGTGRTSPTTGDSDEPPYESGVAALRDGWRLIQAAQLIPPYPGHEYDVSFLKHEFFFERIVDMASFRRPAPGAGVSCRV
jgi:hypothetical protein